MTDEKIIALYFSRSENAITETNKKYGSYCFKIANNILNNREDSEECVNDTWMKTWDSIPPTSPNRLNLYLAKIVRNLSFTRYKSKHALKRGKGEMTVILDELEECIAGQADIESIYLAQELNTTINDFVRSLSERDGNVFIRRYFFADSTRDIARRYMLTENNVRVILNRTRNQLKDRLAQEGYIL
jgi:RNA polymerase sigma-70 factor (ECF subfamily)